jgi:hypothetical protein
MSMSMSIYSVYPCAFSNSFTMTMVIDDDMEHIDTNKEMDIDGYTVHLK